MKKIITLSIVAILTIFSFANAQFFEVVPYVGALSGDVSQDWTKDWTEFNPKTATYVAADETVTLNGASTGEKEITTNVTLDASKVYLLKGMVVIRSGGSLTIPEGTLIRCEADITAIPANYASIVVERGGQIFINGSKMKPVVFTSNKSVGNRNRGDWGGIVLCGKSLNNQGADVQLEGFNNVAFDALLGKYGGTVENDNSGSITYCRMEFGGVAFEPNKEINGITFGSVGTGTTIHHLQVSYSGDDSYEWFGGSVRAKHLIAFKGTDDDFDTDYGFRGAVQFGIGAKDSSYFDLSWNASSGASTSEGFESDNDASGSGKLPLTSAVFSNMSMIGPIPVGSTYSAMPATQKSAFRRGVRIRRNSRLSIINSVFMGYRNFVMYDGDSSMKFAGVLDSSFPSKVLFRNNLIVNSTAGAPVSATANGLVEVASGNSAYLNKFNNWLLAAMNSNRANTVAYTAGTVLVDPQNVTTPNWNPVVSSPALSSSDYTFSRLTEFGTFNSVNTIAAISNFVLYPNPAQNIANAVITSNQAMDITITISDLSGHTVNTSNSHLANGINTIFLPLHTISNGLYIVSFSSNKGVLNSRLSVNK